MPRKNIIAIALGVVAVLIVIIQLGRGTRPMPTPETTPPPAAVAKAATPAEAPAPDAAAGVAETPTPAAALSEIDFAETNALLDELSSFVYDPFTLKDPMRPLIAKIEKTASGGAKSALASAVLGGIVWTDKAPLALVDNQVVGEGDYIGDDILVAKIAKDKVTLRRGDEETEIFLEEE